MRPFSLIPRNLLLWLGLLALAFANGALRELVLKRWVPEPGAHLLSALTAALLFGGYAWIFWPYTRIRNRREAIRIGALWWALTTVFETLVLNRWVSRLSWEEIARTYDVTAGELWPLVLLWVGFLPFLLLRLRGPAGKR